MQTQIHITHHKQHAPNGFEQIKPFLLGGISGCLATTLIQPIDTVKVRIQCIAEAAMKGSFTHSTNPFTITKEVIQNEGFLGLYRGLDAALLRQVTYGTARLGLFRFLSDKHKAVYNRNPTFLEKIGYSSLAGFVGCLFGNPADVSLVRFQRDSLLPQDQRRNYKNVGDALARMIREEGILSLWRGSVPSILRGISVSVGQLTTYDEVKERLNTFTHTKDTNQTKIIASTIAGVVCATLSLPFDNAKTKLQGMKANSAGVYPYKNIIDCMGKSISSSGITGLWIGLPTYIMRVAPHAITVLLAQDYLHQLLTPKKH